MLHVPTHSALESARIRVRGRVQGVGFRPFVWTLAQRLGLNGWVRNDGEGVLIHAEGAQLSAFLAALDAEAPPLATVDAIECEAVAATGQDGFAITPSDRATAAMTMVPADTAPCPACLDDIFNPSNRRHRYAFTNCTHCGPRYTITRAVPYDRAQTSMASFALCSACQKEYNNPANRRFHAQPNACPDCGPRLSLDVAQIVAQLRAGRIVALKGAGGYQLAVDATNDAAVERLRRRKQRDGKPFAVMVASLASARRWAAIDDAEAALLEDRARPILICRARADAGLAPAVSNGLPTVGLMLPGTPLHYLLYHQAAGQPTGLSWLDAPQDLTLVMTSANPGGSPLITDDDAARDTLAGIADVIVSHDRPILTRCDDSVVRVIDGAPAILRRARGFAPEPIQLVQPVPPLLAVGGHLKTTVCVTRGAQAFLSQHVGDLDDSETFAFFRETIAHLCDLLQVQPEAVACDLHPDFLSTQHAESLGLPIIRVQHHHAHLAAVAAEHHVIGPRLGLALDGFGLGADGKASWGGERLVVDGARMQATGQLMRLRQPGGDAAAREPWRMALSIAHMLGRAADWRGASDYAGEQALILAMLERGVNAPETSSAGRLFDAASGLLGVRTTNRFEGEAAMALEGLVCTPRAMAGGYRINSAGVLDFSPLLGRLLTCTPGDGANLFHGTLAAGLADWAANGVDCYGLAPEVLVSGGCLQNRVLSEALTRECAARGLDVLRPVKAPANDGGLALGQAWVAAQELNKGRSQ